MAYAIYTDTPKVPGAGEQVTLYYRVLLDLFFIRPLLSTAGDVANFPNTKKQIQRVRQIKKMKKYVQNGRIGQNHKERPKQNGDK